MPLGTNWLDLSSTSNKYLQMYVKGFLDISGGNLILRNNNFFVQAGDSSLNGNLFVASNTILNGDVSLNSRLFLSSDASFGNNLFVLNKSVLGNDVSMNSRLFVNGDVSMNGNLFVNNNTILDGDSSLNFRLYVGGDVCMNSNVYIAKNTIINGDTSMNTRLFVNGDVSMNGNLFVNNNTILDGDSSLNYRLYVGGDVCMNSNVYIAKNTTMNGDISMNSRLFVGGDVSMNGNLFVNNNIILDGDTSLNIRLFVGGDVSMGSKLFVNNDTTLNANVFVNNELIVAGDASLNGNLYVANNTIMNADVSINNNLTVAGNITGNYPNSSIPSSAIIGGVVSSPVFNADVSANQRLYVNGDASFNNRIFVGGDLSVNGRIFARYPDSSIPATAIIGGVGGGGGGSTFTTDISTTQRLFITGDASFQSKLWVNGNVTLNNLSVTGTLTAPGFSGGSGGGAAYISLTGARTDVTSFDTDNYELTTYNPTPSSSSVDLSMGSRLLINASGQSYFVGDLSLGMRLLVGYNAPKAGVPLQIGTLPAATNVNMSMIAAYNNNFMEMIPSINAAATGHGLVKSGDAALLYSNNGLSALSSSTMGLVLGPYGSLTNGVRIDCSNVVIGCDLSVNGRLFLSTGTLASTDFTTDVSCAGRLFVKSDTSMNGNLVVQGAGIFKTDLSVNSRVFFPAGSIPPSCLTGASIVRNDYISYDADGFENQYNYTGGYVVSINPLNVTNDISCGNRLFIGRDVSANGNLYVANNVGIGKSNPSYPLDVSGNGVFSKGVISNGSIQNTYKFLLSGQEYYGAGVTSTDGIALLAGVNRADNRQLWIGDSARLTQDTSNSILRINIAPLSASISSIATNGTTNLPLTINASTIGIMGGNVGIGTSSPSYLLDVNGNTRLGVTNGSAFKSVRVMTFTAGTTATSGYGSVAKTNITWGVTYSDATKLIPVISWSKPLYGGSQTGDMFTIGLEAITTTGAVINLWRLDNPGTGSGVVVTANVIIYEMI